MQLHHPVARFELKDVLSMSDGAVCHVVRVGVGFDCLSAVHDQFLANAIAHLPDLDSLVLRVYETAGTDLNRKYINIFVVIFNA